VDMKNATELDLVSVCEMVVCTMLFVRGQVFRHMTLCCSVAVSDSWKELCICKLRARMSKEIGLLDPWKVKEPCFFRILETSHSTAQCQVSENLNIQYLYCCAIR